jgi:hypothetical protein
VVILPQVLLALLGAQVAHYDVLREELVLL